jgi:hypothetical protein
MPRRLFYRIFWGGVLLLTACTRPVPGVLTLAPAGMRTTGSCTANPDGTLTMSPGGVADSEVYVDAGDVTVTVTAKTSAADQPASMDVWFGGSCIGTTRVQSTDFAPFPFRARARASGPAAIRIAFAGTSDAPGNAVLHLEKIVITQP